METIVHVLAVIGSAVGATWVLAGKLTSIQIELATLVSRLEAVEGKVVHLEVRQQRRQR